jgi:hypothetical protein
MQKNGETSMVNTRGRVMWVNTWEIDVLRGQGAKVIFNPKQDYYPQYDLSLNPPIADIVEYDIESSGVLEVELL